MGSPFTFPGMYSQAQDPREDYYNLYSNYASRMQVPDPQSFLDPNDPELVNLRNLYARPTGSMDLVNDYISRMPTPDKYQPTTGTKIGAFLLGTFGGGGYKAAKAFTDEPYADAYRQWTDEGKFIDDQQRLIEADRAREIKATEFGIRQKASAAQRAAMERRSADVAARDLTRGALTEEERRRQNEDRDKALRLREEGTRAELAAKAERLGLERERLDWARKHATDTEAAKANTAANTAKQTKAYGDMLEKAKAEVVNHPVFKQFFQEVPNPLTKEIDIKFIGSPEIKAEIDKFIQARIKNYQLGNYFPTEGGY